MYSKFVQAIYYFNIILQSIFSLLCPVLLLVLLCVFLTGRGYVGDWIYVPLILFGVAVGLYSMLRFVMRATAQVRALEAAEEEKKKARMQKEESLSGKETDI